MDSKEAIIAKIIDDAEKKANEILADSAEKAKATISGAEKWADEYKSVQRDLLKSDTENLILRRKTVAELDCRKILLAAKRELLRESFDVALEQLCSLPKKRYLNFLDALILEYAELGDEIVVSENAPVKPDEVAALPSAKKLGLKAAGKGNFKGGILLVNKTCDKDLAFETLLDADRASLESLAADMFFSGK